MDCCQTGPVENADNITRKKRETDQVISGIGFPAVVAIILSVSLIIQESFLHAHAQMLGLIRRKLLEGLSDQQILYGIGIQAVGLAQITKRCWVDKVLVGCERRAKCSSGAPLEL